MITLESAQALKEELIELRRDFHRHPEVSFEETRTATVVADYLTDLGLHVQTKVGGTGVVGLLRGEQSGPTLAVRADMDALPIEEEAEHEYVSQNPGIMHACGHDAHMAIVLGAAKLLTTRQSELAGDVKFIFQPGEEVPPGGARPMIEAGVLEAPHVDAVLGLHLYIEVPVGQIALRPGQFLGGMGTFEIDVLGQSAGGSVPHRGTDAIAVSAQVITSLQQVISRGVNPLGSATLTITQIRGGGGGHVMADYVELHGAADALDPDVLAILPEKIEQVVRGVTDAYGARYQFRYEEGYPPLNNDAAMARLVTDVGKTLLGSENVQAAFHPVMAADDLAYFTDARPGVCFLLGIRNSERGIIYPHHHPRFDVDEDALPIGVAVIAETARRYLVPT